VSVKFAPPHSTTVAPNENESAEKASSLIQKGDKIENENCNISAEQNGQSAAVLNEHAASTNQTDTANISVKETPKNELALAYANRLVEK